MNVNNKTLIMKFFIYDKVLHNHFKNVSIVCLELLCLAFFDVDCGVVSPGLFIPVVGFIY